MTQESMKKRIPLIVFGDQANDSLRHDRISCRATPDLSAGSRIRLPYQCKSGWGEQAGLGMEYGQKRW